MIAVSFVARLVDTPRLTYTNNGAACCRCRCVTERRYRGDDGVWASADESFWSVTAWRALAEALDAAALAPGDEVLIAGKMRERRFNDGGGERTVVEIDARHIGVSLGRTAVSLQRVDRHPAEQGARDDAWAVPAPAPVDSDVIPW